MLHGEVLVEEFEAGVTIQLHQVVVEFVAAREETVELVVAEADAAVIGNGATVVHAFDIGPQTGAEAHVTGFAGSVEFAAGEVEGVKVISGIADSGYLAVTGGVVVLQNSVVAMAYDLAILDDDGAERATMALTNALAGFVDGHLHKFVYHFYFCIPNNSTSNMRAEKGLMSRPTLRAP